MNREPPIIDMRPDGTFVQAPGLPPPGLPPFGRRLAVPMSAKFMLGGILVAAVGVFIAVAALAIWVVSLVLPVIIIAAAVAWTAMKFRRWQSFRGQPLAPRQPPGGFPR